MTEQADSRVDLTASRGACRLHRQGYWLRTDEIDNTGRGSKEPCTVVTAQVDKAFLARLSHLTKPLPHAVNLRGWLGWWRLFCVGCPTMQWCLAAPHTPPACCGHPSPSPLTCAHHRSMGKKKNKLYPVHPPSGPRVLEMGGSRRYYIADPRQTFCFFVSFHRSPPAVWALVPQCRCW